MGKIIFIVAIFYSCLFSNSFKVNDKISDLSLLNQFDKKEVVSNDVKIIIVSFQKDTGKDVNDFLTSKDENFLKNNNAVFIANISGMPAFITKLFALPKMKSYKHNILLIYDENDKRFIAKDDKSTLYMLKDGVIQSISFIAKDDLENSFK